MDDIFEQLPDLVVEKIDLKPYPIPEDVIIFGDDTLDWPDSRIDMSGSAELVAAIREAKEKHLTMMFTNDDDTRAVIVEDANHLNHIITVNGVPFEEI